MEERLLLGIAMFGGAIWSDIQTRRVANQYWWPFMVMAAVLFLHDLAEGNWRMYLLSAGFCGLMYLFYSLRIFGGADAKGLMVLAWLAPGTPDVEKAFTIPAGDALVNATFITLALPIGFLVYNLVRGQLSWMSLLGVRMRIEDAESRHVWPMHKIVDGKVVSKVWQQIGTDLTGRYQQLRQAGMTHVWATPKIPFMVPLLIGLILVSWFGNLVMRVTLAYRF